MSRESIDLCGIWKFQPDPTGEGERADYFASACDDARWRQARLPAVFEDCAPGLDTYEGTGWFRRRLTVPATWQDRRVLLRFQGVNYHADVWINGDKVGENQDPFLPFAFPIHDHLRFGGDNLIAVRVDNVRRQGEVPGIERGWRTYGGILREVELEATDLFYIEQVAISAEPGELPAPLDQSGRLSVCIRVRNERPERELARISIQVRDASGKSIARSTTSAATVKPGEECEFSSLSEFVGIQPWSPADPVLYTAVVELHLEGQPVDVHTVRFGFRKVETREGKLLLNGEPIYLTGFNRHEDSPERSMATDLETARKDLLAIKETGANFVRLCHYPHHPGELDLCDELGLLSMDEIPLYWWNGLEEGEENCTAKLAAARRQLTRLIQRDFNHPSIIFWSVSNETEEHRPEVVAGNAELVRLAKKLDPTRPAIHVSCHWQQDPHFEEDDVVCVNAYPSLDRRGFKGRRDYDLAQSTQYWRDSLQTLHERYPDRPILVTEFGYASLTGVRDSGFGEEAQARAIEAEFAGMDASYICGATIWCWADHPWPPGFFSFCYHLATSPYGVVTRRRHRLQACGAVRKLFRQKQEMGDPPPIPFPEISSPGPGVHMIRSHLRDIPQIPFPEGFGIRPMRVDEGSLWLDIERDAEDYLDMKDGTFEAEFSHDLQAVQWRSFIATNPKGAGVGTVSAWYHTYRGEEYGLLHWVAVRPAYQGRGLGKAMVSFALEKLAQWHDKVLLGTQAKRLPAIKLYLDFGFAPDLEEPGAVDAWRQIKEQLKHPLLENLSL